MFRFTRFAVPREAARQVSALGLMGLVLVIFLTGSISIQMGFALFVSICAGTEAWRLASGSRFARTTIIFGWTAGIVLATIGFAGHTGAAALGFVVILCLAFVGVITSGTKEQPLGHFGGAAGASLGLICLTAINCLPWLTAPDGSERVALVIWATWAGDAGASLMRFSHRDHRRVWEWASPGKTWAGVALGAVFSWAFAGGFLAISDLSMQWVEVAALLILVPILGPIGDLCESILKRCAGAKDSGSIRLLPGHGGVLDRTDSLVLTIPCILGTWEVIGK
jgi:phosphatidate cytidylyltransferase